VPVAISAPTAQVLVYESPSVSTTSSTENVDMSKYVVGGSVVNPTVKK
jgi:hypothetical protein